MDDRNLQHNIEDPLDAGLAATEVAQAQHANKPSFKQARRISLGYALAITSFGMIAAIVISIFANQSALDAKARTAVLSQTTEQSRQLAEKAYEEAKQANAILLARGQAPVPVPPPSDNPADTIASAAAAKVVAQLPKNQTNAQDIAPIIGQYLADHPQGPTAAQIANQISAYFATNPIPPGKQGEPGEKGEQGPPPTTEQILASITTYCSTRNECRGPTGDPGPQGISITNTAITRIDGTCVFQVTLTNPANGATTQQNLPINDAMCPIINNPPDTTTPTEPTQ
jgi:hypothetical protein